MPEDSTLRASSSSQLSWEGGVLFAAAPSCVQPESGREPLSTLGTNQHNLSCLQIILAQCPYFRHIAAAHGGLAAMHDGSQGLLCTVADTFAGGERNV